MKLPSPLATASTTALLRYILESAGLGLGLATAVAGVGCGGDVVVDQGHGGGATTTTSGTTTGTTMTTTVPCNQPATVYAPRVECVAPSPSGCLPITAPELAGIVLAHMNTESCGPNAQLASVLCGPTFTGGQCCYVVDGQVLLCGGRPFLVGGTPHIAPLAGRADWIAREATPAAELDPETRRLLADGWARAALDEHASIASFARFALELLAVGAPAALVRAAQQAMGDEIRHAELCFALASTYAGQPVGPGRLPLAGQAPDRVDLAEIAAAAVREGCVGETMAAFEAASARDQATDPAVRAALDALARDEAEHAALAYRFVAWALRQGGAEVREAVRRAFAQGVALRPPPASAAPPHPGLRAHGRLAETERHALARRCAAEVIAPSARALLAEDLLAEASA